MALSFVQSGAWSVSATTIAPALPTGWAADDLLVLFFFSKYNDATLSTDMAALGWTDQGAVNNTGRPTGNDNGNLRGRAFTKIAQSGETAPSISIATNNVSAGHITAYRVDAGETFSIECAVVADDVVGSPLLLVSTLGVTTNDIIHIDMGLNGDVVTWGTSTITAAGATLGTMATNVADATSTTGTDIRMRSIRRPVSSGTGVAAQVSTTLAGTTTNAVGVGLIVRIRAVAAPTAKSVSDTIAVSESLSIKAILGLSDAVSISETVSAVVKAFIAVSDNISIAESIAIAVLNYISVTDNISIAEALDKIVYQFGGGTTLYYSMADEIDELENG